MDWLFGLLCIVLLLTVVACGQMALLCFFASRTD